jgi:DNA polymerase-1
MTAPDGTHTNAVYGFLSILRKVLADEAPDYLAVAFDTSAPTFRHKMYEAYKGTRQAAPEEFHEQVPLIKEILGAMEIPHIEMPG